MKRIDDFSNPVRCKLSAIQIKIRRERRQKLQAKYCVKHLITYVSLNKKWAELNVLKSQKLALKKIIEGIMLCMSMNIRSIEYYKFLHKNNILPFPCMRTIHSYFSLIKAKRGFDEHFVKFLEKYFASKISLQYLVAR
ncbi:hypothetical protein ACFW04_000226 [Cataglyphis niger]